MTRKTTNKKKLQKKLLHKYRLVVLNEDTFEERLAFKLTRLNVFVLGLFSCNFIGRNYYCFYCVYSCPGIHSWLFFDSAPEKKRWNWILKPILY